MTENDKIKLFTETYEAIKRCSKNRTGANLNRLMTLYETIQDYALDREFDSVYFRKVKETYDNREM